MRRLRFFAFLSLTFIPSVCFAFPEMVRLGYFNCSTCHFSSTGGGLLTQYGRALSKEAMSHSGATAEEDFLYGLAQPPKWLQLGGDTRFLQFVQDTPSAIDARFIVMQLDLEGRAEYKRLSLQATAGRKEPPQPPAPSKLTDSLVSHRHWVSAQLGPEATPDIVQARVGRFYPAYGLNIADHPAVTRRGLGFDSNQETYNAELAWLSENIDLYGTAIFGRPDNSSSGSRRGGALQLWVPVAGASKIGLSGFTGSAIGESEDRRRTMGGAHAIVGFSSSVYALLEGDVTHSKADGNGLAQYLKLGWEFTQGVHAFVSDEYQRQTYRDPLSVTQLYGVGIQYFPRPHFEFLATYAKSRTLSLGSYFSDEGWILFHFYL